MKIKGCNKDRQEEHYDFFIRNDSTLSTVVYLAWMIIKDVTIIKVSSHNS